MQVWDNAKKPFLAQILYILDVSFAAFQSCCSLRRRFVLTFQVLWRLFVQASALASRMHNSIALPLFANQRSLFATKDVPISAGKFDSLFLSYVP